MPRNRFVQVTSILVVAAAAFRTGAQSPAPQTAQPTFRSGIVLVTLDVIPRDDKGNFVTNLTSEEFQVLEDGAAQDIASVTLVHGGRVRNVQPLAAPRAEEGILLPAVRAANQSAGRVFLLVIDDLHLNVHDTPHVRALLKKVASTLIHEGDLFSIISTGPSAIEEQVSYDRNRLLSAISRVKGGGLELVDLFQMPEGSQGPPEVRRRAHVAFTTAYRLVENLGQVKDRRKALILVSNGYDLDPFPAGRAGKDQVFGGRFGTPYDEERGERLLAQPIGQQEPYKFGDLDLALELRALVDAANRSNVTVYSIDPRGISGTVSAAAQVDMDEMRHHLRKTQDSLRTLAEGTGGLAVVNDNDFTAALKRIDAETSDYYMLAYYSSNPDITKRTRQIAVRANRPDVTVWSRSSYKLRPQTEAAPPPR